jgi:hypothetical protein
MGYRVIEEEIAIIEEDEVIRHNPEKLAQIILNLTEEV